MWENIKRLGQNEHMFVSALLVVVAVSAFSLGQQSVATQAKVQQPSIVIFESVSSPASLTTGIDVSTPVDSLTSAVTSITQNTFEYVASRAGTRFHHISCPGAKQIKEENKLFFVTPEAAAAAGYTRAANCQR